MMALIAESYRALTVLTKKLKRKLVCKTTDNRMAESDDIIPFSPLVKWCHNGCDVDMVTVTSGMHGSCEGS